MTTEQLAFLAAIRESPDDDVARLVYADFLDDQTPERVRCPKCEGSGMWRGYAPVVNPGTCEKCSGSGTVISTDNADRAEFIRVQVERERIPHLLEEDYGKHAVDCVCTWCRLRVRESALLAKHRDRWLPLCVCCSGKGNHVGGCQFCPGASGRIGTLERGFMHRVDVPRLADVLVPCQRCDGDGLAHGADRPFEWSADPNYMKCPVCKGAKFTPTPWATALLRDHPTTQEMWCDDAVPWQTNPPDRWGYWEENPNWPDVDDNEGGEVPPPLFQVMWDRAGKISRKQDDARRWLLWQTAQEAWEEYATGLCDLLRKEVGQGPRPQDGPGVTG